MPLKLIYFSLPARAEVARLLLTLGGVEFEDHRMARDEWASIKPDTPFGQVPVLQVDGKYLAQSVAIDRYCAQLAGLLPEDPWAAALADQAYCYVEDIMKLFYATFSIKDADEKVKARQEVVAGPLKEKFSHLSKLLASKPGAYVAGDKISHGDLALFCMLSTLKSGWLDGVPKDLLDAYPDIKAYRNAIASVPGVAAYYAKEDDDIRVAFRAD